MSLGKRFFAFSKPIENFFKYTDDLHICWKDIHSTFLGCSEFVGEEAGLSPSKIIGLDDRDLIWQDHAPQYRKEEEAMLNSRATRCIYEPIKTVKENLSLLTFKTPMTGSSGLIEGIFAISFALEHTPMPEITNMVNKLGLLSPGPMLFPLSNQVVRQQLSKREQECLFYLTQGKSAKEIGSLLGISPRTIEAHIVKIKSKLRCQTRSKLISTVMDLTPISS